MKKLAMLVAICLGIFLVCSEPSYSAGTAADFAALDEILQARGQMQEGAWVVRFPRSDLNVKINGEAMPTALGFVSWAAFKDMGKKTMVMGDLVLLEEEVYPVISALAANDLQITALHNHFLHEQPRIMFMHVEGMGTKENLATGIRQAIDQTGLAKSGPAAMPAPATAPAPAAAPVPETPTALETAGQPTSSVPAPGAEPAPGPSSGTASAPAPVPATEATPAPTVQTATSPTQPPTPEAAPAPPTSSAPAAGTALSSPAPTPAPAQAPGTSPAPTPETAASTPTPAPEEAPAPPAADVTQTPATEVAPAPAGPPLDTKRLEEIIGHPGQLSGEVFKITVGRKGFKMHGMGLTSSLGLNSWAAFVGTSDQAHVAGDIVMTAKEVNPVIKALRDGGIEVVAVHNHMLTEQPRAFFLHYWGSGPAENLARIVRSAFDELKATVR